MILGRNNKTLETVGDHFKILFSRYLQTNILSSLSHSTSPIYPQHTYLYSSPTVSEIRDCFSNDTVPCHVISAMLSNSQRCVQFHSRPCQAACRRCVQSNRLPHQQAACRPPAGGAIINSSLMNNY